MHYSGRLSKPLVLPTGQFFRRECRLIKVLHEREVNIPELGELCLTVRNRVQAPGLYCLERPPIFLDVLLDELYTTLEHRRYDHLTIQEQEQLIGWLVEFGMSWQNYIEYVFYRILGFVDLEAIDEDLVPLRWLQDDIVVKFQPR